MKTEHREDCEDCHGKGWLLFDDNQLQRCDQCQRFDGDLDAAVAFFADPANAGCTLLTITVQTPAPPKCNDACFEPTSV